MTEHKTDTDILIVDDKPENLRLLSDILKSQGYGVRLLRKGNMVMSSVLNYPPDLILLDIMMPETDGYEVCRQLKADEKTCKIPVIFISALNDVVDKVKAFSVGGVDYISKPFNTEEVLARVKTHLTIQSLHKELQHKNAELEEKNIRLQEALDNIKNLQGMLPICSVCKKIRDDQGYWNQIEAYLKIHSDILFTHGICPECAEKTYGNEVWYKKRKQDCDRT
ncbi:MAG: response regulator [Desulfobacteraceae bacterium IS3]|nr:MAG: response regulator [Desulfobacteraceae bacterium IS3]